MPELDTAPGPELQRDDPDLTDTSLATAIRAMIAAAQAALSVDEALALPPVGRGVDLILSHSTGMTAYAVSGAGAQADPQPLIVSNPDPDVDQAEFVNDYVASLLFEGEAVLQLMGEPARPVGMRVLPAPECDVTWADAYQLRRQVHWRGERLARGSYRLVALRRRPGQLRGKSPLRSMLPYLAGVKAAEDFATSFFASGGMPGVVLKVAQALDEAQADAARTRYMKSRVAGEPSVLSGGASIDTPGTDPEKGQMQQSRAYGATIVSRGLGIPGALLHVETSGATVTYTNPEGAIEELIKGTILPMYLRPLERIWSAAAGAPVRFDTDELQRVNVAGRAAIDAQLVGAGILEAETVRPRWSAVST